MPFSKRGTSSGAGDAGTGTALDIRSLWTRLDPATRQWFLDHTGTAIVPRTISVALCRASEQPLPQDTHGQIRLTPEDTVFIRNRAHSAFAAHGTKPFFDAVQPEDHRHGTPWRYSTGAPPRS